MFKSKKLIAIILVVVVMLGSLPFVYTSTSAAYFSNGSKWVRTNSDYGKIETEVTNLDYKFMQIEDNQEFTFNQHLSLEKSAGEAYAHFNSLTLYTGLTNTDSSLKVEEYPAEITSNGTQNLLDEMNFKYSWKPTNDNASDIGVNGNDIPSHDLRGTVADLSGCPDYQWDCNLSFNAVHPVDAPYGEIKTNYYWDFNWTYADVGIMGSRTTRSVRFCTDIIITDARELISKVNEYKTQINDFDNGNTNGLAESDYLKLKKYVDYVPSNMLDGSKFYSQIDVDAMYDYITGNATGLADYSEYYRIRSKIAEITKKDSNGYVYGNGYTTESLDKVTSEYTKIDEALNKSLTASFQSVVDEATADLIDVMSALVAKNLYSVDTSGTVTDDVFDTCIDGPDANLGKNDGTEMNFHLNATAYKFIQIYDDEIFDVHQEIYASSRANTFTRTFPYVEEFTFDETSCVTDCFYRVDTAVNNTTAFLSRVLPESLSDHENGSKEFNQWKYVERDTLYDGSASEPSTSMSKNGYIERIEIGGSGVEGLGSRYGYWADADILFKGDSAEVSSEEENLSFVWRLQVDDDDGSVLHLHLPVEVLVTDARDLVKLYDELNILANGTDEEDEANRLKYTEASINALRPVLETVPQDLLYGSAYYTQTEVDVYYNNLLDVKNALEPVADYTEYNETYGIADSITNDDDKYEPSAFANYRATIATTNDGLDKRLGETQQNVVDAKTQELVAAMVYLEENAYCDYTELDRLIAHAEATFPADNSEGKFRDDIYTAVMEALANAKAVERNMVKGSNAVNQKTIDDAAEELLYAIYYDYYNTSAQDIIKTDNQNGDTKIYLDEAFEKFKTDYESVTDKLEEDVNNDEVSNHDAFEDAAVGLSNAHTSLEEGKFVDLTDINNAITEGKNTENEGYTDSSWGDLQDAIKDAEDLVATNPVQGENGAGTKEVEDKKDAILDAIENLEEKADYSGLENALEEAGKFDNTDNKYTNSSWSELEGALEEAENLDKDMASTTENQGKIDEITEKINSAITNLKEKADYSLLNEEILKAEEVLADTSVVYTDSSKKALQDALTAAKALDNDLSVDDQQIINNALTDLTAAREGIKIKADYTELDKAVEEAKEALDKTDVTYTDSTKQALENALTSAENVNRDLSTDDQQQIDDVAQSVKNATDALVEAADTSKYEDALENAKEIISGGNEDNRYDEEDWNSFVDSVTEAEKEIGENTGDIPKSEQEKVDSATDSLTDATTEIYNKRYIFVDFKNESGSCFRTCRIQFKDSLTFNDLTDIPSIPESDGLKKYVGWYYTNGTTMNLTDAITDDVALFCIEEEIKLVAKAESGAEIDETKSFFKGLAHNTTVDELLAALENDLSCVVIKDKAGNVVENTVVIATGMTVELISKTDRRVVNETVTVVVKGDVNGDGLVNGDDFNKAEDMCLGNTSYGETDGAYFAANDTDNDGVLDVIDLFNISNMRFGN